MLSIKLGMRKKPTNQDQRADEQLLAALNRNPQLKERILTILRLATDETGEVRTADEIEALLIAEIRQLGRESMEGWAQAQAERVSREVEREHPQAFRSKKNACSGGVSLGASKSRSGFGAAPK
jgi:hypothetical protein